MTVSALFVGLLGLVSSFAPEEMLRAAAIPPAGDVVGNLCTSGVPESRWSRAWR